MEHRQALKDILKTNASLGCLGGLFKLALSTMPKGTDRMILQQLLREIEAGRNLLKAVAQKIA